MYAEIEKGEFKIREGVSGDVKRVLMGLIVVDPGKRMTAREVLSLLNGAS